MLLVLAAALVAVVLAVVVVVVFMFFFLCRRCVIEDGVCNTHTRHASTSAQKKYAHVSDEHIKTKLTRDIAIARGRTGHARVEESNIVSFSCFTCNMMLAPPSFNIIGQRTASALVSTPARAFLQKTSSKLSSAAVQEESQAQLHLAARTRR